MEKGFVAAWSVEQYLVSEELWTQIYEHILKWSPIIVKSVGRSFLKTYKNTFWRKAKYLEGVWSGIISGQLPNETYASTYWREAIYLKAVWIMILSK